MNLSTFHMGATTNGSSPQNLLFYTAPSSPMQSDYGSCLDDDEFEFKITSRMITNKCEFQQTYPSFWWKKGNDNEEQKYRLPARAKSFCSGQILPLKPPPRINTSVSSSPRSPGSSLLRIPFSRPCTWNDDFDPFQFALEKVSDETRARMSFHRRSHSYSAYRTSNASHWLDGSLDRNNEHNKHGYKHKNSSSKISNQGMPMKPNGYLKPRGPTLGEMIKRRESVYSRRVLPNEQIAKPMSKSNPMARTTSKDIWSERRVKDVNHQTTKARSESSCCSESKTHRLLSFLFNMKKSSNERKISCKLRRCLGYAPGSPPFMK